MNGSVAGLVLAAGEGRRFGGPKALATVDGVRLVDLAVGVLRSAELPVYVVSGAAPLNLPEATVVENDKWRTGMGSSLRAGLAALPKPTDAALVIPVDQPGLTSATVRRVLAAAGPRPRQALVVATYRGRPGHPVLLGRDHWAPAAELAVGDTGARAYLSAHAEQVTSVDCEDLSDGDDVDRPEDLARYQGMA